ncbi:MAG: nitrous oxide reductase family maturation protein NosD, partial [Gemmatimonadota bacterium]|nr:nitrous oxide reductase family maturation protein NosD [Gemmatimonadota bacterium]
TALGATTSRASRTLVVGAGEPFETVQAALDAAGPGDTVVVSAGIYAERPVVRAPVVLRGLPGAVLDGRGRGTVLTVTAPAHVSGLTIRGSGRDLSREDSGVMVVEADDVVIEDLALEDVLFGVYLKQSRRPVVRRNRVTGKPLPVGERGDGIRLWYCQGGEVSDNTLERVRDLVIWFSSNLEVSRNVVRDSRYGVHYMYSDHNRFEENEFRNNHVGAFIMYSSDISFRGNLFLEAYGPTGVGLGLKDADDIRATENSFIGNGVGISLDNSPASVGVVNEFRANLLAHNDLGVSLLPSVHSNDFRDNAFVENTTPVAVTGGGDALANTWEGNHWSEYAGFDENGDGIGDTAFRHDRVADALFARRPELRWLTLSPAAGTLDLLGRLFPLLEPEPIVIDPAPRIRTAGTSVSAPSGGPVWGAAAIALAALGVGCAAAVMFAGRRRRWAA